MIVAPTATDWYEYTSWFTARGKPAPIHSSDGVFVRWMDDQAETFGPLLAGCSIFPTDGPFAVVEYAATNPHVSMRLACAAMDFGVGGLIAYGILRGKAMLCFPSSKGMHRMLCRKGFSSGKLPYVEMAPWKL